MGVVYIIQEVEMKCPLPVFYRSPPSGLAETEVQDCLKEKCAWWEEVGEGCAMPLLALRLGTICETLDEIWKKMPHSGQFVTKP